MIHQTYSARKPPKTTPHGSHELGPPAAGARCLQRAHTIRTHPGVSAVLSAFLSLVTWRLTLTFKLGRNFCTTHLTAKFHHPTFNRLEVIVLTNKLTNKQTPLKTSTSLRYATPMGNKNVLTPSMHNINTKVVEIMHTTCTRSLSFIFQNI